MALPARFESQPFHRGFCNICGTRGRFFYESPFAYREQLVCEGCRSTSRYRSIARGILAAIRDLMGLEAPSLTDLPEVVPGPALRVYDTQLPFFYEPCAYPIPEILSSRSWIDLELSTYRKEVPPGAALGPKTTNQNLERLTFPSATFDIVVTSDVMEHVRLDGRAHAEIARVLKGRGAYLFTVPHFRDREPTLTRVEVDDPDDPSKDRMVMEPEYHGDANAEGEGGVLSYRTYGTQLDLELESLGFDVAFTKMDFSAYAILGTELFYCRKRPE